MTESPRRSKERFFKGMCFVANVRLERLQLNMIFLAETDYWERKI
jgi:hypothetical protein